MAAKKTSKKTSKKDQKPKRERPERILPKQAPQGVPGTPRGKCAFPKGWEPIENEHVTKNTKPCGRDAGKGKWCGDHKKEVRYYQLALNNIPWRSRIKENEAGHYLWRDGRPTMAALTSKTLLAKAREQAIAKGMKAAEVDKAIREEMKYLETHGARSNPSVGPDKKNNLVLISKVVPPVQTRLAASKPKKAPKAPKKPIRPKPVKKVTGKVTAKKPSGSKSAAKPTAPTPKAPAPAPKPAAPPPPKASKPIGAA